ncbi:hypothetical protein [Streptomyces sp. MB09-02B]|uniref:hypothetical protein n=1 Tax=Streptomyces sp. MB09-02B TaxID=3028667 RepID=UPI0029A9D5A5|nr:hypothetical protein [Streptomyces sp. MB09-02B]MDX3642187.1 hypothetical protein [Streptomyces sp. MB09-02B]
MTPTLLGECKPNRNGANDLSTHTTPDVKAWLAKNPHVHFNFPPRILVAEPDRDLVRDHHPAVHPPRHVLQRQRPGQTDPRLHQLLERERETLHLDRPADEILAKVRLVQTSLKKLVNNNSK